jgi:hypothetical protein
VLVGQRSNAVNPESGNSPNSRWHARISLQGCFRTGGRSGSTGDNIVLDSTGDNIVLDSTGDNIVLDSTGDNIILDRTGDIIIIIIIIILDQSRKNSQDKTQELPQAASAPPIFEQ